MPTDPYARIVRPEQSQQLDAGGAADVAVADLVHRVGHDAGTDAAATRVGAVTAVPAAALARGSALGGGPACGRSGALSSQDLGLLGGRQGAEQLVGGGLLRLDRTQVPGGCVTQRLELAELLGGGELVLGQPLAGHVDDAEHVALSPGCRRP